MRLSTKLSEVGTGAAGGALVAFLANYMGLWAVTPIPFGTAIAALMICGAALGWFQRAIVAIAGSLMGFGAWLCIGLTPIVSSFSDGWVRSDSLPAFVQAVVVTSSAVASDSALDPEGTERLIRGLEIARRLAPKYLVTTRAVEQIAHRRVTSDDDQARLVRMAGLASIWRVVDSVTNTRQEAVRASVLLLPLGFRSIALVTSPMHTRRACATFERVGFRVYCVPSRENVGTTWHPVTFDDRLAGFRAYLYERLGMVKYRTKGWAQ